MVQLVGRLLPTPEIHNSNPVISNYIFYISTVFKDETNGKERPAMAQFLRKKIVCKNGLKIFFFLCFGNEFSQFVPKELIVIDRRKKAEAIKRRRRRRRRRQNNIQINIELEKEGFFVPCCFGCQSTQNFAILFDTEWLILSKLLNL